MSVLSLYVDRTLNQCSPVQPDVDRVVKYDGDGVPVISYVPTDYTSIVKRNGVVSNWSLDSLMKAGVDPSFHISTGLPTRLEGLDSLNRFASEAEKILTPESAD